MKNSIRHHVNDDLLMAYSTGNLPEAFSIAVAAHISMCDICRSTLESFNAVGGVILESNDSIDVPDNAFAKTMQKIKSPRPPLEATQIYSDFPAPLSDYVGFKLDDIKWQPIGMGVKQSILPTSSEAKARLLYIPPGTEVPDHSHDGIEMTLVLDGAFADENEYFSKGDIEIADGSTNHTPVATDGRPCICLAVTEAPLKFRKVFHRLIQPLMRI
jgi:putative transcriptional regulator